MMLYVEIDKDIEMICDLIEKLQGIADISDNHCKCQKSGNRKFSGLLRASWQICRAGHLWRAFRLVAGEKMEDQYRAAHVYSRFFVPFREWLRFCVLCNCMKRICKRMILALMRHSLPLAARKRIARWVGQRSLFTRLFPPVELLRDVADYDPNYFHRFLWSNHLGYAESYEVSRFGPEKLDISRRMLFADIQKYLRGRAIAPERDVRSVFECGCSLGYLLRYAETNVFHGATSLLGVDVDMYAIEKGRAYLREAQSKIQITAGEASYLEPVISDQQYDVVLCCGVLLYFDELTAARIVKTLLRHTRMVLGLISLAHSDMHNCRLKHSERRPSDQGFVHNLDAMIRAGGGRLVARRWMPRPPSEGTSPPYFVLAEPRSAYPL